MSDASLQRNDTTSRRNVFIAGATGYIGAQLAAALISRGHAVSGLVRPGSENRLPTGCRPVRGNALDHTTFSAKLTGADTFVQLVGVAHPSPAKAKGFREIDLVSFRESLAAAVANRISHFVYVSVAHPAPVMKSYVEVRTHCESLIRDSGLAATILRPWYVLGPGHYWPYLLKPLYWLGRQLPPFREGARRLGLVTREQMVTALRNAVESPVASIRIIEVPEIAVSS